MKLKNKFLSLIMVLGLAFGVVLWNRTVCSAIGPEEPIKVVFLGDTGVGKTSILMRMVGLGFSDGLNSTIGSSQIRLAVEDQQFVMWDTAGQERFRALAPMYIRDAKIVIFVFDLSIENKDNVKKNLSEWIQMVDDQVPGAKYILVGNKQDLCEESSINEFEEFTKYHNMIKYFEVSAKTDFNIDLLTRYLGTLGEDMKKTEEPVEFVFCENAELKSEPKNSCCK